MFQKTTMTMAIAAATVLLTACGGGGSNNGAVVGSSASTSSNLIGSPTTTASLSAAQFTTGLQASATGQQLLQIAGTPTCGVTVSHIQYNTIGGAGEATTSAGAVMVPTGSSPACSGARPVVLYAHGTTTSKNFNMAALLDPTNDANGETTLVAATFAAQGYIVIAPNYAGYDTSTLSYHPYVNYAQQSQEMLDALKAGRITLAGNASVSDSGKLYVTGYSEGGYVAMAALKALDAAHIPVAAGAPMSGPYALEAYGDAIFYGNTPIGGTVFAPLLTTSYQKAYGNIYNTTTDVYNPKYAAGIDTLFPSSLSLTQIFTAGTLPQTALFQAAPTGSATLDAVSPASAQFSFGFDPTNYLVSTSYRGAYLADAAKNPDGVVPTVTSNPLPAASPANTLRQAFKLNDLRGYIPSMPVLMCGGNQDPTVFFAPNAEVMAGIWGNMAAGGTPIKFAQLDVDATTAAAAKFTSAGLGATATATMGAAAQQLQTGFASLLQQVQTATASSPSVQAAASAAGQAAAAQVLASGGTQAQAQAAATSAATAVVTAAVTQAIATSYHGTYVPPFCTAAARTFFQQY